MSRPQRVMELDNTGPDARRHTLRVLVAGCAGRDHAAFERLYRLTAPKLYALVLQVLRRRELAEEVLQEVYTQIWREASRFERYDAAPMTWMTVMARNRAIDVLRRGSHVVEPFDEHALGEQDDQTLSGAVRLHENHALRQCLDGLQTRQREAILLAFFQGLSHRELAKSLATPIGTVKSWIRRGLSQLKQCLNGSVDG